MTGVQTCALPIFGTLETRVHSSDSRPLYQRSRPEVVWKNVDQSDPRSYGRWRSEPAAGWALLCGLSQVIVRMHVRAKIKNSMRMLLWRAIKVRIHRKADSNSFPVCDVTSRVMEKFAFGAKPPLLDRKANWPGNETEAKQIILCASSSSSLDSDVTSSAKIDGKFCRSVPILLRSPTYRTGLRTALKQTKRTRWKMRIKKLFQ